MALHHDHTHHHTHDHRNVDHAHVVPVRETIVRERGSSAGVLFGLIIALVIIGLIVWGIVGSGWFNTAGPTTPNTPGTNPRIDININQPGNQTGNPSYPGNPSAPAPSGPAGSTNQNPAPDGSTGGSAGGAGQNAPAGGARAGGMAGR